MNIIGAILCFAASIVHHNNLMVWAILFAAGCICLAITKVQK